MESLLAPPVVIVNELELFDVFGSGVVDEMVTNALYDAPIDREGRPRFAHLPRTEPVRLERGEEIHIQFCSDAQLLGVAVSDPFGALSKQVSLDYLSRCFARQSRPLESRAALEAEVARLTKQFGDGEVSRPAYWHGYRLVPLEIEFWRSGDFRLHDRIVFRRVTPQAPWSKTRLYP